MSNMPSNMTHSFSQVPSVKTERSIFRRPSTLKTTLDAGYLVPIYLDEVLPGDSITMKMNSFGRLATPLKPIMDNMYLDVHWFYVPNRLLWDNWESFMGAKEASEDVDYVMPTIPMPDNGPEVGTLADYFGLPTDVANGPFSVQSLPFRAYNLIYKTWYGDQNLIDLDAVVVDTDDGPDTYTDYVLRRRGKRHDYFTSALPWPQKGDAVTIPFGADEAPITRVSNATGWKAYLHGSDTLDTSGAFYKNNAGFGRVRRDSDDASISFDPDGQIVTDLSSAVATSINQFREAMQLQVMLERDARGGTRYVEILKSHFGVTAPDFRLQRPEFLGGSSSPVNVHPLAQTTSPATPTNTDALGNLAGFGTVSAQASGFAKGFVEHGWIIGIASVRADLTYQTGIERFWSRSTRYDHYWPALAHLGEQAILNKEIYADVADGTASNQKDGVFGYQERYAEYRYKESKITGEFRSSFATPLDNWHLSQEFTALPTLGQTFIEENPPVDRCIAVTSAPHFLLDCFFDVVHARPMPVYGVPGLGDRF